MCQEHDIAVQIFANIQDQISRHRDLINVSRRRRRRWINISFARKHCDLN